VAQHIDMSLKMDDRLFQELAARIRRSKIKASRTFAFEDVDVQQVHADRLAA
jgi:hypothetical protein